MKRWTGCLALCLVAVSANANITVADIKRASAAIEGQKWEEAIPLCKKLVDECPVTATYWGDYGQALFGARRYKEAILAAERAASLGYYPWICYYSQAKSYAELGDKEKTLTALQRALDAKWYGSNPLGSEKVFDFVRDDVRFKKMIGADFDREKITRNEGWVRDLDYLLHEARRQHFNFDAVAGKKAIDEYYRKLRRDIPKLSDHEVIFGMIRLMAMGGDGHTWLQAPITGPRGFHTFPIQIFGFKEGYFVTAATQEYKDLLGQRLTQIGAKSVDEVAKIIEPTISAETRFTTLSRLGSRMMVTEALHSMRVIDTPDQAEMEFADASGKRTLRLLKAIPLEPAPKLVAARDLKNQPLYLKNRQEQYWYEYLGDRKILYVQYNAVQNKPEGESLADFWKRVFKFAEDNPVEALVLDIRWNGGGNLFLNDSLIASILASTKINDLGKLFVITGRNTYSAAASLVGKLDRMTNALFVGEPAGSSPNFVGENGMIQLPYSGLRASISSLYWQNTHAMDHRSWVGVNIPAEPTWELFIQNRDPAMEAIFAALKEPKN